MTSVWQLSGRRMGCVYRAYDPDGVLLYIGSTSDFEIRREQHMTNSIWRGHVDHWRVRWYTTDFAAWRDEVKAIRDEHPRWNIQHRSRQHPEGFVSSTYELVPLFPAGLLRPESKAVASRFHGRLDAYLAVPQTPTRAHPPRASA